MNGPGPYDKIDYEPLMSYAKPGEEFQEQEWDDICPIPEDELPLVVSVSGTLFTFMKNDKELNKTAPVIVKSNMLKFSEGEENTKWSEALRIVNEKYLPEHQQRFPDKHQAMKDAQENVELRTGS